MIVALACSIIINNGVVTGTCDGLPLPDPVPIPVASVCPSVQYELRTMKEAGQNDWAIINYGAVLAYKVRTDTSGTPVLSGGLSFASTPGQNPIGTEYEISFSPCPGDFNYAHSDAAAISDFGQTFHPCSTVGGADQVLNWSDVGSYNACKIPANQTFYMNYRIAVRGGCLTTCGQTFGWNKFY